MHYQKFVHRILLVAALAATGVFSRCGDAQTVYEPWDYSNLSLTQGADILGQVGTGSTGFDVSATSWNFTQGSGAATYDSQGLSFLGPNFNSLNTAGGAATIAAGEPNTKFTRMLETAITRPATGEPVDDFWVSFLLRRDSSDGGGASDGFWSTDGLWDKGAVGSQGIDEIRFVNGPPSGVAIGTGTTNFVATRILRRAVGDVLNPTVDNALLYVNPALDSEPAPGDANAIFSGGTGTNDRIRDAVSALFKFNGANNGVFTIDEFRIGDTYASVAPFTATNIKRLARYTFAPVSIGVVDRTSDDTEPLTLATSLTGGADFTTDDGGDPPMVTGGNVLIDGNVFNDISTSAAFSNNNFVEFTIGIDQATSISMQELSFNIDLESSESVFDWAIRSSADGFVSDIASGDFDGIAPGSTSVAADLEGVTSLQGATSDVTFRIAFANALADIGSGNGASITLVDLIGTVEGDIVGPTGDYDGDEDVDGADFLAWQRGESPNGATAGDLQAWQDNYGQGTTALSSVSAIPEPMSLQLLVVLSWALTCVRGRNVQAENPMC